MTKLARKASCHLIILSFLKDDPTLGTIIGAPQLKILKTEKLKDAWSLSLNEVESRES